MEPLSAPTDVRKHGGMLWKTPVSIRLKYLKNLILTFPFFERVPDQSVIAGTNGERYDRAMLPVEMTICWFTITQDVLCRSI